MRALLVAMLLAACDQGVPTPRLSAPTERLKMGLGDARRDDEIDVVEDTKRGVTCYLANGPYGRPNISCVKVR